MRIIGYIQHPSMKITVFKTDTRFPVKFEKGFLEQTYKFIQQNGLEGLREIRQLIDKPFLQQVEEQFSKMEVLHTSTLAKHIPTSAEDEFDEII